MAVGDTGYSSTQPAQYNPEMQNVYQPTRTWATTGNTDTVIDASVHPSSCIAWSAVGATPAGFWKITVTQGQFVVTSSDSESAGLTYTYRIL